MNKNSKQKWFNSQICLYCKSVCMHITLHGKNHTCRIGIDGLQLLLTISKYTKQQYAKILTQIGIARKTYKILE